MHWHIFSGKKIRQNFLLDSSRIQFSKRCQKLLAERLKNFHSNSEKNYSSKIHSDKHFVLDTQNAFVTTLAKFFPLMSKKFLSKPENFFYIYNSDFFVQNVCLNTENAVLTTLLKILTTLLRTQKNQSLRSFLKKLKVILQTRGNLFWEYQFLSEIVRTVQRACMLAPRGACFS